MLLDALRDFEWLNEPLDVNFEEAGMRVLTHNKTDFWAVGAPPFRQRQRAFFLCPA